MNIASDSYGTLSARAVSEMSTMIVFTTRTLFEIKRTLDSFAVGAPNLQELSILVALHLLGSPRSVIQRASCRLHAPCSPEDDREEMGSMSVDAHSPPVEHTAVESMYLSRKSLRFRATESMEEASLAASMASVERL